MLSYFQKVLEKHFISENNKWIQVVLNNLEKAMYVEKYHINKDNQHSYHLLIAYSYALFNAPLLRKILKIL